MKARANENIPCHVYAASNSSIIIFGFAPEKKPFWLQVPGVTFTHKYKLLGWRYLSVQLEHRWRTNQYKYKQKR